MKFPLEQFLQGRSVRREGRAEWINRDRTIAIISQDLGADDWQIRPRICSCSEAMTVLLDGGKVRKQSWSDGALWQLNKFGRVVCDAGNVISTAGVLTEFGIPGGWEIIE